MYGNKGISFTLEAIIAGFIIVASLLFFFNSATAEETYEADLSERGYECLKSLDEYGKLREDAMSDDNASIGNGLQDCLAGLNYTVQICRTSCNAASAPENITLVVSNYFIAGDVNPDQLYVKLNMWLQ